ncbi:hypothetical protein C8Q80DRAFT_1264570 [Daedaleopsis nitida]|nr:hypothetical protein C8Q80DRAFT_1264570 [Daedaleopsis nitida]
MSRILPNRATTIPAKRKAQLDSDLSYRLSRSMTADIPHSDHLLFDALELPPPPLSNKRRVNPDSLALRLGPELVAELESFVQPGVIEMPSFAIRQEIQMRHNVDRRHIYDWFHSKGLRVTKEDKRATVESKTDAMRLHRRVRNRVGPPLQSGRARALLSEPKPTSQPSSVTPAVPHSALIKSVLPPQPWKSAPVNLIISKLPSSTPARPPLGSSRHFSDPYINSVYPVHADVVLDEAQRQTCYDTLSRILGPAEGIQECVGSYGAYMTRQRDIFYEDILGELADASPSSVSVEEVFSQAVTTTEEITHEDSALSSSCARTGHHILQDELLDLARVVLSVEDESSSELDTSCSSSTLDLTYESDLCLELDDILASPTLQEEPSTQLRLQENVPATKSVSFAPVNRALLNYSSLHFSLGKNSVVNQTSSSLAGALGDIPMSTNKDQGTLRKAREWIRPRMGRARAYSAGGGM